MNSGFSRDTHSILRDLVRFDTTSFKSNLDLIDYVASLLTSHNIHPEIIYDPKEEKANLLAFIGPKDKPAIVLSGHTDVVPVDGQNWTINPFDLTIKDGKAFGRGTCDMKGFIASALAALPAFVNHSLANPICFALSYDEEVGCTGVRSLLDFLTLKSIPVQACIIGEPSSMKPVTAHTGKQVFRCNFHGTPLHSSLSPGGVNAIAYAGRIIHKINELEMQIREQTTDDDRFAYAHPTINIGTISGGKAVNIVAEHCCFDVECRYPPETDHRPFTDVLPQLIHRQAHHPMAQQNTNAWATCEQIVSYPSFRADPASAAVQLARKLTGANDDLAVNYGTEAGLFQQAGFSSVVCGPGDIAQAHQPDEYIDLKQLERCDRFMQILAEELTCREPVE